MQLSKHFSLKEFTRSQTSARNGLANVPDTQYIPRLVALCENVLEPLRAKLGVPLTISSGYRSPELNTLIGGANDSQHTLCEAADVLAPGFTPLQVCQAVVELGVFDQVIHEFGQWCHVSYSERHPLRKHQMTAEKRDGRTVYLNGLLEI